MICNNDLNELVYHGISTGTTEIENIGTGTIDVAMTHLLTEVYFIKKNCTDMMDDLLTTIGIS